MSTLRRFATFTMVSVALLASCGTTRSTSSGTDAKATGRAVTTIASKSLKDSVLGKPTFAVTPASLHVAETEAKVAEQALTYVHAHISFKISGQAPLNTEMMITTDRKTNATRIDYAANASAGQPGFSELVVDGRFYMKKTDDVGWTKLAIDPSLTQLNRSIKRPSNILDRLGMLGVTLERNGSQRVDGQSMTRYDGSIDVNKFIATMGSTSELASQVFRQLPANVKTDGKATVLLDPSGLPHEVQIMMHFQKAGKSFRMVSTSTYLSAKGIAKVDEPTSSEISQTIPVLTAGQYERAVKSVLYGS